MAKSENKVTNDRPKDQRGLWKPPAERVGISPQGKKWLDENAEAIQSMNEWVEKNGLPLAKYRQF